ncbi:MAG TPA: leucine--tRNA ligase [Candidatus Microsaccharimonas sp.]|nr:leucine--tRNA ligase [Candidatus Microsaccharimonas sp.]
MKRYDPRELEPRWQKTWDETGVYTANLQSDKPKYIAMSMFNYPSGNLHIGHAMNFTISDVKARFKRQQGYESYHPVGWDSFGLPAENRAIKEGLSPQESMAQLIPDYRKAYKAMGWSNDWEKEIATHLPEYYQWTQWVFSEMYRNGLAYQDSRMQWWCEKDNTVLANEQVIDGKCWRHDGPDDPLVEKKEIKQWFFKITDYADELLDAIEDLDWTDTVKLAQKNWIGRSVGAEVSFKIDGGDETVTVFTTRPDTLYGATFMVIAPEHELVKQITTTEQKETVDAYVREAQKKSELERQTDKQKTGAFTGAYAINPVNGAKLPIWIADYVLAGYGTGAIMAVPAHDERDEEFAKAFDLPIVEVIDDANKLVNSGKFDGQDSNEARETIVRHLEATGQATSKVNYKMRDWSVSRQRYWGAPIPIINCPKDGAVLVPDEQLPVVLPELDDFKPAGDGRSALARATDWLKVQCPECGGDAERETDTLDTYICSSWYMYRYMDPRNQAQIFDSAIVNKWEPIDFYNGGDHATAHLLYARFIGHFFKRLGLVNEPEPFKQFLFNGKIMAADGTMFSKSKGNGIDPLEIINQGYGADALRMFLMFAAPLDVWAKWDPQGVPATHRFISRLWNLVQEYLVADEKPVSEDAQKELLRATHGMIKKMTIDIEENRYNTAIAAAMGTLNELYKLKVHTLAKTEAWLQALEAMIACIAPFAPFAAEELWFQLGHHTTVHKDTWPAFDEAYLAQDTITVAVQVNGKLRGEIEVAADEVEDKVVAAAQSNERVKAHTDGHEIVKTIYITGKLVNIVVR